MKIQMIAIGQIKEYGRNPRTIPESAVEAVAHSIKEFGFRVPVLLDKKNTLVAGHTRVRAAKTIGMTKVPAIYIINLTRAQIKAFRIADNQLTTLSDWDFALLPDELAALKQVNFDLGILGFGDEELAQLLMGPGTEGLTDPDDIPEPPDEAITKPGDLIILGNHFLLCGDAGKTEDVDRLLDGAKIQLVNCDPPYNVKVEPRSSTAIAAGMSSHPDLSKKMHHQGFDVARGVTDPAKAQKKMRAKDRPLVNDFISDEEFEKLLLAWFGNISRVLEPGRGFYVWGGYANLGNYPPALKKCELYFSQGIVWDKQHPVLTRKDLMGAFELAFYGWRKGAAHKFFGPNNATDLWHVKKINPQSMQHLTQKPTELAVRAIQYSSRPGENVLDLFGGSGSTLIACEQTGRIGYTMELDTLYCDLIVDRFQRYTGVPGVLERTGTSPIPMKAREENMR